LMMIIVLNFVLLNDCSNTVYLRLASTLSLQETSICGQG
jgi:hypothetical protein